MDIFGIKAVVSHFFNASSFATVLLHKLGPCGTCQLATPSLLESFFVIPFALSCFACAHLPPGAHRAQAASFRDHCLHYSKDCLKRNVHAASLYHPQHKHIPSMTYQALDSKNFELVIHAPEAFPYQSQTCLEVHKINVKLPLSDLPKKPQLFFTDCPHLVTLVSQEISLIFLFVYYGDVFIGRWMRLSEVS